VKKINEVIFTKLKREKKCGMPLSTSSDNSLDENNSFLEFKYPQDSRFRLRKLVTKI
jgi:hypothetical protein